jgi:hypothetical protein
MQIAEALKGATAGLPSSAGNTIDIARSHILTFAFYIFHFALFDR